MPDEALVVKVDGKELLVPTPEKTSRLAVPVVPNRAQRRQMARSNGKRGAKAKRERKNLPVQESEEQKKAREFHESQEKVIESARNIRDATRGAFWLPGDKAR